MNHLNKLISKDLVIGLPKLKFEKDHICEACQKGKQVKSSFKIKNVVSSLKPLELLHMDLFGPSRTMSLGGNYYALVIVDDFSRFTWTLFLESKSDTFSAFKKLARRMQNTKNFSFWADAVSTSCYVMNRVLIRPILKKTPYELFNGRKPNINHLRVFGCICFVLNNGKENLGKFDEKADLGIFIGYSLTSHAYRI